MVAEECFTGEQNERGFKLTAHLPIIMKSKVSSYASTFLFVFRK
jgi:hypothetical protein